MRGLIASAMARRQRWCLKVSMLDDWTIVSCGVGGPNHSIKRCGQGIIKVEAVSCFLTCVLYRQVGRRYRHICFHGTAKDAVQPGSN